jgi:hypothetical protein
MEVSIMQPYFLPYIGYFQLINAVELFVYYDDVNYIKQGWINRNRILLNGDDYLFTLELLKSSSFKLINSIEIGSNRKKLFKTIEQAYLRAPYYKDILPMLQAIFNSNQQNLFKYVVDSNQIILNYLNIKTKILFSSNIDKDITLKGQDKIIEICKKLGASSYLNPIGGKDLYSKTDFSRNNISLSFLKPNEHEYNQFQNKFIPWLSIIDVMMFNPVNEIIKMLGNFELI